jgi:hypothetical protein
MPSYVSQALQRLDHPTPARPQYSPHACATPKYGKTPQMTPEPDSGLPVNPVTTKRLQQIIGVFLYNGRAVDSSILVALGTLAFAQTKATTSTMYAGNQLMDYVATHPTATIRYQARAMILAMHSYTSYLSETESRSRAGGIAFLSSADISPKLNSAIHVHSSIMKMVLASATEAEVGALFFNAQEGCSLRQILIYLGYKRPATAIQTDNECAHGIMNSTIKQRRSKAIDMRFYWLRDRMRQLQFQVYWEAGARTYAEYFSKHHPTIVHDQIRHRYFHLPGLALSAKHAINGEAPSSPPLSTYNVNALRTV